RAYYRQKPWKRIVVILAGPLMNLLIAFFIFFGVLAAQGGVSDEVHVVTAAPATQVLRPGDRLLAVDGHGGAVSALRAAIKAHRCWPPQTDGCIAAHPARLTISRGGRRIVREAYPIYSAANRRPLLGFQFGTAPESAGTAAKDAATGMWRVTKATVSAIGRLFFSSQARKQVTGVVGSYETTREAFASDTTSALEILAIISLSLAIVNLFPFLPLDGGHVFWALAEKVRGRPIAFEVMERAGAI